MLRAGPSSRPSARAAYPAPDRLPPSRRLREETGSRTGPGVSRPRVSWCPFGESFVKVEDDVEARLFLGFFLSEEDDKAVRVGRDVIDISPLARCGAFDSEEPPGRAGRKSRGL